MSRRCIVCGTELSGTAIRLEQIPELRDRVARDLQRPPDAVSPQESICVPCFRRIQGPLPEEEPADSSKRKYAIPIVAGVAGAAATVIAAPLIVAGLGFTAGGIAAGSAAASLMSASATTGIGAGVVATLQSIGAAGFSAAGYSVLAATGGAVGGAGGGLLAKFGFRSRKGTPPDEPGNVNANARPAEDDDDDDDDDKAPGKDKTAQKSSGETDHAEGARGGAPENCSRPIQETGKEKPDEDSDSEKKV